MRGFLIACALLCSTAQGLDQAPRAKKQFSLFSVVQFDNLPCEVQTSGSSVTTTGVCYTTTECNDHGGVKIGNCASGFGVCCMVKTSTCGSTVSQNCSYIQNPGHPTAWAPTTQTNCQFNVKPCNNNICQMRLEFETLQVSDKQATGLCGTNTLTINGPTARDPPVLCGTLTGQHIYVENGRSNADTTLIFAQQGVASSWNIKVIQIECDSKMRAPGGCLQYYTGAGGQFKSLGRGDGLRMLQSGSYSICFRREGGMCEIDYTVTTAGSFELGTAVALKDNIAINTAAGATNFGMAEALLIINGADKLAYGGEKLANAVPATGTVDEVIRASSLPFSVVNTGTLQVAAGIANKGFDLTWNQVSCS